MNAVEPELITIVEGPAPEFQPIPELWPLSVREDSHPMPVVVCQMRTFNGPKMVARCQRAWKEDRPVKLDFPDGTGMRQQINVVAARWTELQEGHVLHLWVQVPPEALEEGDSFEEEEEE